MYKCSIDSYGINVAPELLPEEKYQRTLKLLFDIRNANRASLPPIVNIVDLAKFRPHDLPTLQVLSHALNKTKASRQI